MAGLSSFQEAEMADYFTHFSCLLDVGAGNVEAALALYSEMAHDLEADDGLSIGFVAEPATTSASALWLHDEDHGEPEHVIAFALLCAKTFDLKGRWGFSWALACSRPRLDAFGGGAQLLDLGARRSLAWTDCGHWLETGLKA
jgi:hypothetical protein